MAGGAVDAAARIDPGFGSARPGTDYELAAPRMARAIITAVLVGYAVNTMVLVWGGGLRGLELLILAACLAAVFLLQVPHSTSDIQTWPVSRRVATLGAQTIVTFAPLFWVGPEAGATAGFLAGSVLLVVSGPTRWLLFTGVGLGIFGALTRDGVPSADVLYGCYFTLLTGLTVYGVSSLASLAETLHSARGNLVRMAVIGEQLRLARDLHDLLGFNISAIMLKSELAYRLLPGAAEQARREIRDVLGIAHRALADVRAVAHGSSPMSLATEVTFTQAMLTTAEIEVQVHFSATDLPEQLDTVLAIVLREAATNILRHSKAETVQIDLTETDGRARLCIRNDGVGASEKSESLVDGAGLQNLTARLQGVSGQLTAVTDEDWFRLTVEAPLVVPSAGPADPSDEDRAEPTMMTESRPWHLRIARLVVIVVLSGYGLLVLINVVALKPGLLGLLGMALCLTVEVLLLIGFALSESRTWPIWARATSLMFQTAISLLPLLWIGEPWGSMGGFVAGSFLLALSGPGRWVGYGGVGVGVLALSITHFDTGAYTAYLVISTLLTGLVTYGVGSLANLVAQVDRFREELARLAVNKTRLAAADQLNEFIGRDLSLMTVKSELANRLLPRSLDRARTEVAEVLQIARLTVAKVRSVASGYRHQSFAMELESAVSALRTSGVLVESDVPTDEIPADLDALLALVLRGATMNTLARRAAKRCLVEMSVDDDRVHLRIADDGIAADPSAVAGTGCDVQDLAERIRAIGGQLIAEAVPGWFHVVVDIPRQLRFSSTPTEEPRRE